MVGVMNLHRMIESTVGSYMFPLGRSQNMQYDLALYPGRVGGEKCFFTPTQPGYEAKYDQGGC